MIVVRRGVTGFFNQDARGTIPEFTFAEFRRVVLPVAASLRLRVSNLAERGVTPNFHSALTSAGERPLTILGHSAYPIVAFAEPAEDHIHQLRFADCEPITRQLRLMFPEVSVATADELAHRLTPTDLAQLDVAERQQIKYWKPTTVGELAFNWWD